jgi:hypothetical protein
MKKVLLFLSLFIVSVSNAQVFDGVELRGAFTEVLGKYKAKGYALSSRNENGAILTGRVPGGINVELMLIKTPKSHLIAKAVVFLPKRNSWYELKQEYEKYQELFIEKYGETSDKFSYFIDPWYEGDGYELSAVKNKNAVFVSYWLYKGNANIALEISKYCQISMIYENIANMKKKEAEEESSNKQTF